jgi:plasmid stability protein
MANLTVRKIDDAIYRLLQARAAAHGVSMEEEVRRILQRAVVAPEGLGQWAIDCFGSTEGVDLELPSREPPHEPPELG